MASPIKEKLIVQSIISIIILAIVFLICLIDHPRVESVRISLHNAISGHVTVEQVTTELGRLFTSGRTDISGDGLPIPDFQNMGILYDLNSWTAEETDESKKSTTPGPTAIPEP
jgi:hypothetical protein